MSWFRRWWRQFTTTQVSRAVRLGPLVPEPEEQVCAHCLGYCGQCGGGRNPILLSSITTPNQVDEVFARWDGVKGEWYQLRVPYGRTVGGTGIIEKFK